MIILMGVAGAGKSMQGKMLADEAGYPWLSTGELLRVLITGRRRHEMLEGKLLSDEEVINVVNTVLGLIDLSEEFVLDGFPRTLEQANWVLEQEEQERLHITAVFHLNASENLVRDRLLERGRMDDTSDAIAQRFEEYHSVTLPMIKRFKERNIAIFDIDGATDPRTVHEAIMKHLGTVQKVA